MARPPTAGRRLLSADGRPQCRTDIGALAGYLVLTLILTCPLARQFARAIPGDGFDGWQNYWNLWWIKTALIDQHTHPFFTNLLYHPTGVSLLFHTLNPFNGLISLPIQVAWGLFPAYNTVVLFCFTVGGFGVYLLACWILGPRGSRLAAFGAGVIFAFSPFHFAHLLGHMQVISLEWIPFYALYLLRIVQGNISRETTSATRCTLHVSRFTVHVPRSTLHNVLMATFFLVLIALCDMYYVLYCLLFTAVVLAWTGWRWWRYRRGADIGIGGEAPGLAGESNPATLRPLRRVLVAVVAVWLAFGLMLSPLLLPMIAAAGRSQYMIPDPAQSRALSADLAAFVTPQEFHPIWGVWAREQGKAFTSSPAEHQVFAGFTVMALAVLGLWAGWTARRRRKRDSKSLAEAEKAPQGLIQPPVPAGALEIETTHTHRCSFRRELGPWPLVLLTFFVLALGPVLRVTGRTGLLPGGGEIALPYRWLVHAVPFMNITRSVSRFDVMVMLALALLAAFGLQWLWDIRRTGRLIAGVALSLVLFEFLPVPYPMSPPDTPKWYETLSGDPRSGAVLNLPMNWDRPGYLLYQTVHRKPLSVAYVSRDDPRTLTERAPVLQHFRHLGPDIIRFDLAAQGRQVLHDLDVGWVVLDRYKMPGGNERNYTEAAASQVFGDQAPVYQDDRLTVYEVTRPQAVAPYLILGIGWEPFDQRTRTRAFVGQAPVVVQAPAASTATLRVELAPDSAPLDLPMADGAYVLKLKLQPGSNEVELRAARPGERVVVTSLALG